MNFFKNGDIMFVKNPNLPDGNVKCVIIDRNAPKEIFDYLTLNGIDYIKSCYIKNCVDAVSTHPDMQICHIGENLFACDFSIYEYYKKHLNLYGVNLTSGKNIGSNYPSDISYNVVITGNNFFHYLKYTEKSVLESIKKRGFGIYDVKQGYTKCATCIIDKTAVITADCGLYKIYSDSGFDCLLIDEDDIILGKENNGFFGGCCGMIGYKKMLFCGDVSKHKSFDKIYSFAKKYSVELISGYDGKLTDIGSIIPVIQE